MMPGSRLRAVALFYLPRTEHRLRHLDILTLDVTTSSIAAPSGVSLACHSFTLCSGTSVSSRDRMISLNTVCSVAQTP
jgi:hypothetical protein